jgi:hypothetical protein
MAVISFTKDPGPVWGAAAWVFQQVMDDILANAPRDPDLVSALEDAKDVNGLVVRSLGPDVAARVTRALIEVVTRILAGEVRSGIHDQKYGDDVAGVYNESLVKLLALAKGEVS